MEEQKEVDNPEDFKFIQSEDTNKINETKVVDGIKVDGKNVIIHFQDSSTKTIGNLEDVGEKGLKDMIDALKYDTIYDDDNILSYESEITQDWLDEFNAYEVTVIENKNEEQDLAVDIGEFGYYVIEDNIEEVSFENPEYKKDRSLYRNVNSFSSKKETAYKITDPDLTNMYYNEQIFVNKQNKFNSEVIKNKNKLRSMFSKVSNPTLVGLLLNIIALIIIFAIALTPVLILLLIIRSYILLATVIFILFMLVYAKISSDEYGIVDIMIDLLYPAFLLTLAFLIIVSLITYPFRRNTKVRINIEKTNQD